MMPTHSKPRVRQMRRTLALFCALLLLHIALVAASSSGKFREAGDKAFAQGSYSEALSQYTQLINAEPKSQLSYFKRAAVHLVRKDFDAAIDDLDEALKLDPSFIKGYMHRVKVHKMRGDFDLAADDLNRVLKLKADHKEASAEHGAIAKCLQSIRSGDSIVARARTAEDFQQARAHFTSALECAPESPALLMKRAETLAMVGEHADVVADTGAVIKASKNNLRAYLLRGRAYYFMGEPDMAVRHYKEGLRLDPDQRDLKDAFKKVRLLEKRAGNGEAAMQGGRWMEAVEEFQAALDIDPEHPHHRPKYLQQICTANLRAGAAHAQAAVVACTKILERGDHLDAIKLRADAYLLLDKFDEAIADLQKCIQLNQGDQGCHQSMHKAQNLLKRSKQKDYYKLLGVSKTANDREIKQAFKKLALQLHPDKIGNLPEAERTEKEKQFREIAEAYEVLSDAEKRGKYDRGEDVEPNQGGQQQQQQHPFHHFFQQGGPFGGGGGNGGQGFTFHFG